MEFSYEVHYRTGVPLLKSDEQLFETLEHNQVRWLFLLQIFSFEITILDFSQIPILNIYLFIHWASTCIKLRAWYHLGSKGMNTCSQGTCAWVERQRVPRGLRRKKLWDAEGERLREALVRWWYLCWTGKVGLVFNKEWRSEKGVIGNGDNVSILEWQKVQR